MFRSDSLRGQPLFLAILEVFVCVGCTTGALEPHEAPAFANAASAPSARTVAAPLAIDVAASTAGAEADAVSSRTSTVDPAELTADVVEPPGSPAATLSFERVQVKQGDKVDSLLAERGVFADGEAFAIVYAMAPAAAQPLTPRSELWLPTVRLKGTKICDSSCKVRLTWAPAAKERLHQLVGELRKELAALTALSKSHFQSAEDRAALLASAESVLEKLEALDLIIRARTKVVSRETVDDADGEAQLVLSTLKGLRQQSHVPVYAIGPLNELHADLTLRLHPLDEFMGIGERPPPPPRVPVVVTFAGVPVGSARFRPLRVYYAAVALKNVLGAARMLTAGLTYPMSGELGEAHWAVWAAVPDSVEPATDVVDVTVRKTDSSKPIPIELVLRNAP